MLSLYLYLKKKQKWVIISRKIYLWAIIILLIGCKTFETESIAKFEEQYLWNLIKALSIIEFKYL